MDAVAVERQVYLAASDQTQPVAQKFRNHDPSNLINCRFHWEEGTSQFPIGRELLGRRFVRSLRSSTCPEPSAPDLTVGNAKFVVVTVTPDLISRTAHATQEALEPAARGDWSVRARDLEWSCWRTGVHLADGYFAHACQILATRPKGFLPIEVSVEESATPEDLLEVIGACAELLRCAATLADPATRAWHPWGTSDPAGSIAMGVVEALVHTYDIAVGLGLDWRPPAELCPLVLGRLFPDAPDGDPTDVLLWCTGRTAMRDRPRRTSWRWDSSVHD